jgi:hypothetical protein
MRENLKSGSMRGGWRGEPSTVWRSEHRRETVGERAPAYRDRRTSRLLYLRGSPHAHSRSDDYGRRSPFLGYNRPHKPRAPSGLMVVVTAWPNSRGERHQVRQTGAPINGHSSTRIDSACCGREWSARHRTSSLARNAAGNYPAAGASSPPTFSSDGSSSSRWRRGLQRWPRRVNPPPPIRSRTGGRCEANRRAYPRPLRSGEPHSLFCGDYYWNPRVALDKRIVNTLLFQPGQREVSQSVTIPVPASRARTTASARATTWSLLRMFDT